MGIESPSKMSLPSRERGLKFFYYDGLDEKTLSLPSRERGLKCVVPVVDVPEVLSLPSRERGLKCSRRRGSPGAFRRSLRGSVD